MAPGWEPPPATSSIPARCYIWVEFVVGSRSWSLGLANCSKVFTPGSPGFPPPTKPTSPNSNLTRIEDLHENQLRLM